MPFTEAREDLIAQHADCAETEWTVAGSPHAEIVHTCGVCPHGYVLEGVLSLDLEPVPPEKRADVLEKQRLLKIHALSALTCADHPDHPPYEAGEGRRIPWL